MSDYSQGPGWWQASDGRWYPPSTTPGQPSQQGPAQYASPYGASPYGAAPAYGAPTYGTPAFGQEPPKNNGFAIASMVCGIVGPIGGAVTCGLLAPASIVAIVLGHIALSQIKNNPNQTGRSMALAGVILGYVAVALGIILVVAIAVSGSSDPNSDF